MSVLLHELVQTVKEEAHRAARVVRDVMTFAKQDETTPRPVVEINEVVKHDRRRGRTYARKANLRLDLQLSSGLPPVAVMRSRWEQVIVNLVHKCDAGRDGREDWRYNCHGQGW
jgi:signal transduction histidine kinase